MQERCDGLRHDQKFSHDVPTHSRGRVDFRKEEEEQDLREFVTNTRTLEIDNFKQIVILDGFIDESLEKIEELIHRLFRSVEKRLN